MSIELLAAALILPAGLAWAGWASSKLVELIRLVSTNEAIASSVGDKLTAHLDRQDDQIEHLVEAHELLDRRVGLLDLRIDRLERRHDN